MVGEREERHAVAAHHHLVPCADITVRRREFGQGERVTASDNQARRAQVVQQRAEPFPVTPAAVGELCRLAPLASSCSSPLF